MKQEKIMIGNYLNLDWKGATGVVIGDEGCIYRALYQEYEKIVEALADKEIGIRYLTPITPDMYTEALFQQILKLAAIKPLKVTFNDYGMLYKCRELIQTGKIFPVIGRILTHSMIDCPWDDQILAQEPSELADAVTGYNFVHAAKWDLVKEFGVTEIEINIWEPKQLERLKEIPFKIIGYADNSLLSVGRVCFAARLHKMVLPECCNNPQCRDVIKIRLNKKWGKMKLMYEETDEATKGYFTHTFLQGNVVYTAVPEDYLKQARDNDYVDTLIV